MLLLVLVLITKIREYAQGDAHLTGISPWNVAISLYVYSQCVVMKVLNDFCVM